MFENVGSKLQTITTGIFYVCSVVYVLAGVISFFVIMVEEEAISLIPLLAAAVAIISQYLITLALVGLGKIVENSEREIYQSFKLEKAAIEGQKSQEEEEVVKLEVNQEISNISQDFLYSLPVEKRRELMMYISSHKMGKITDEIFEREKKRILMDKE